MTQAVSGFSGLTKEEKIEWLAQHCFANPPEATALLKSYWNDDEKIQRLHDEFIENTISNFYLPLGVAPNFLINGTYYTLPMVIEESSVVAAASRAAKFWSTRGGFKASVIDTEKIGQAHFLFKGDPTALHAFFALVKPRLVSATDLITQNMQKRGGGIRNIELRDRTALIPGYYQLHATFETVDSMGANFINSCLEHFARTLLAEAQTYPDFQTETPDVVMSILSNYVPNCLVRAEVACPVEDLADRTIPDPTTFAEKFLTAVRIAEVEPFRAVTHNKGIMNGIDAVVLATGNDFRAVEAGIHAYAARSGRYSSLSHAEIKDGIFRFWIEIPLALGTIGGLTSLHPLVKLSLEMLGKPSARDLMQLVAVAGLAQNFAAVSSLTTTGIQKGHMKMHLNNILNQVNASEDERRQALSHFSKAEVTHAAVHAFISQLRN